VGGTTITGDLGYITGPATTPTVSGTTYVNSGTYTQAGTDQGTALSALSSQPCTFTFASGAINLSTDTTHGTTAVYAPGVYCSAGAMNVGGPLTFNGSGTYIFRPGGALTTTAGSISTLSGASACDIFWTPAQATTLAANTTFFGTVIDASGITIGSTTSWTGRALAFGGTVTTDTDTITVPTCTAPALPATLHVIKVVVSPHVGPALPSDFTLTVRLSGTDAVTPAPGSSSPGRAYVLPAGTYVVGENSNSFYVRSFSGDCNSVGSVTLTAGGPDKTCTITNTDTPAITSGGGGGGGDRSVSSTTPVVVSAPVQLTTPMIHIVKVPSRLTPFPVGGGYVTYTYTVTNPSTIALNTVTVTDDKCAPVSLVSGDTNLNGLLDPTESWIYSCGATITTSTKNTATATGHANGYTTTDLAVATVLVSAPGLPKTGFPPEEKGISLGMMILSGLFVSSAFLLMSMKQRA
jgi:hypothetical protein